MPQLGHSDGRGIVDVGFSHEAPLCEWSCFYVDACLQSVGEQRIEWPYPAEHGEVDHPSVLVSRMESINVHTHAKQGW